MAVVMATAVAIGKMGIAKTAPNLTLVNTPPPPGSIVTPPGEKRNTGRNK